MDLQTEKPSKQHPTRRIYTTQELAIDESHLGTNMVQVYKQLRPIVSYLDDNDSHRTEQFKNQWQSFHKKDVFEE